MSITIEAIYESGVFKPTRPLSGLKEREKVRIIVERESSVDELLAEPIQLEASVAREIVESDDFSVLENG